MSGDLRPVGVFWFVRRPNFGDGVAPLLIERFAGLRAYWAPPPRSDAVVIGSVAGRVSKGYRGVVVGIGRLEATIDLDLSTARVLGLRGELTRRNSGVRGEIVLGDSGLLVAELLGERPATTHRLGVVAHFKDETLRARYPDALHIDVGWPPLDVIRQIASCERIVSSSLHGLIAADSFAIPRRWELSDRLEGGAFKFNDYVTALGTTIEPETWDVAPASQVERVKSGLRDAFRELGALLAVQAQPKPARLRRALDSVAWRLGG